MHKNVCCVFGLLELECCSSLHYHCCGRKRKGARFLKFVKVMMLICDDDDCSGNEVTVVIESMAII